MLLVVLLRIEQTVFSDIDIAIIVSDRKLKSIDTVIDVKLRAEDLGLPIEAFIDMKILTEEGFGEALGKLYKRVIRVEV